MNILYIEHYAGSPKYGMEFRPYYFAKKWMEKGRRVRILAADFSHVRAVQPQINARKHLEYIDDIEYVWYSTPEYDGNGVGRVKNITAFLWRVWRFLLRYSRSIKFNCYIRISRKHRNYSIIPHLN